MMTSVSYRVPSEQRRLNRTIRVLHRSGIVFNIRWMDDVRAVAIHADIPQAVWEEMIRA
jgi:hypothetical protein